MPTGPQASKQTTKRALITGVTGQDGSYLAELLLAKGYEVHGLLRRTSTFNRERIDTLYEQHHNAKPSRFFLHYGDLADAGSLRSLIFDVAPHEVYNLAAQSHVRISFELPDYTADITGLGALRILEVIREFQKQTRQKIKFYQASSSEMFGAAPAPQNEQSPLIPQSPYGNAKVFAYQTTKLYREAFGIFTINGILFNHESPRRGENFVTRKITRGIARIRAGLDKKIYLGNLDAKRDWGYAPEYMEAAYLMMQQKIPDDYVIGTGEAHSIKEFLEIAFTIAGLDDYRKYVSIDKHYYRPAEVHHLLADATKAKEKLKWQPRTNFKELVRVMVEADLRACEL